MDRVVVTVNDQTRAATKDELEMAFSPRKIQPDSRSRSGPPGPYYQQP
ncbi:hypothetical protein ABZ816_34335 [Actinosynnema sp. NPDC047251]|uniref:Uncharacterized protein n=1 Tax=Saccharothrix espanaensis (strain ATCC 51144 / DSM 44229 / JCM 9112 / NBRC 15066 / NRRL 15764) TaxID=1179773 RepID=K0K1K4_SACES|nr:hypothetical protein [Saccharothrix espanaensis]CCH32221.1 hypothetical protein BN6_49510 [Saccharothrix espanaensis DSM 44229]